MADSKNTGRGPTNLNPDSNTTTVGAANTPPVEDLVTCDHTTIEGDGTTANPLRVIGIPGGVVDTDDITIEGDGGASDKIRLKKVFTDELSLSGLGTQGDPLQVARVFCNAPIQGSGTEGDPLYLYTGNAVFPVATQGDILSGTGVFDDPLEANVQCDDDTLQGDGTSANPFELKKVYTDGVTITGTGVAGDPLVGAGGSPSVALAVNVAAFNSSIQMSENAAGTARSVDWLIMTGSSQQPSVAAPLRAAFTSQVAAYRYGHKALAIGLDWYQGNNSLFNDDNGGALGSAALTSYPGEGFPSSTATQAATQGRGYTTNYATGFGFGFGLIPADPFNQQTLEVFLSYRKCQITYIATNNEGVLVTGTIGTIADNATAKKVSIPFTGGGAISIAFIVTSLTVEIPAGIWLYGARLYKG